MESEWVDFKEIKRAVSIEMALAHYNVRLRRVNRESLRGVCPLPSHSSKGEQNFCVNMTKNIWSCQSTSCVKARQGKKGGNVLDFVAAMESCSIRDAALKLANWFNVSDGGRASSDKELQPAASNSKQLVADRKRGEGDVTNWCTYESVENKPLGFALKIDHSPHPYLTARSIAPETALHFGVGFFSGRRRAQQILQPCVTHQIGANGVADRHILIEHLKRLASGEAAHYERRRRLRLATQLRDIEKSRVENPAVLIEAPMTIVNQQLSNLPAGVTIESGQITVRFTTPVEGLEKLLALAMAVGNNLDEFERLARS